MRMLLRLILLLVVLLITALVAGYFYLDVIARHAIERASSHALGVPTTVKTARLSIFDGELTVRGALVENPEGFRSDHFLRFRDGEAAVTIASLRRDVIEIPTLTLENVDMNLERGAGGANYQVILTNLRGAEQRPDDPGGRRYVIRDLRIRDITVHVDVLGVGDAARLDVPIEEIHLQDVGSDTTRGVLLSELSSVIVKALLLAAIDKAGGALPGDLVADVRGRLGQLADIRAIADIQRLGDLLGPDGAGRLEEGARQVDQRLRDLLGNPKEDRKR